MGKSFINTTMNQSFNSDQANADATQIFHVAIEEADERLDSYLVARFPNFSRVKLQRAIAQGSVLVDGSSAKSSTRLKPNQLVEIRNLIQEPESPRPEPIQLDILYEDESLVAINKPPGMVVHPAKGHWSGTLTAALAHHFQSLSSIGGPTRPGIVHRLDRDTSGVILVAKTDAAHLSLTEQFENRTVQKGYFAVVSPAPDRDRDLIDKPIGDHPYQREKKAIREEHPSSRPAQSFYEVLERFQGFAVLRIQPKTGRTHQIRVHLASIGCPVLCDALYSGRSKLNESAFDRSHGKHQNQSDSPDAVILARHALHALDIEFMNPQTRVRMKIVAPLAADIERTVQQLRIHRPIG